MENERGLKELGQWHAPEGGRNHIDAEPGKTIEDTGVWTFGEGERARIRPLNAMRQEDIDRYHETDVNPKALEFMIGDPMTDDEIKDLIEGHGNDRLLYGVSGRESEGEIEGWVQMLPEDGRRIEEMTTKEMVKIPEQNLVMELSYARLHDTRRYDKKEERGLVSSGVRQICQTLGRSFDPSRGGEGIVPELKPNLTITAYTDPENVDSERVLERCGFVRVGQINYDEDSEKEDTVWVLDWKKLDDSFNQRDEQRTEDNDFSISNNIDTV
ncbi:MAG: GNAT family N-acetyltransferase [Candidatus Magasanikbacteria bacterium]